MGKTDYVANLGDQNQSVLAAQYFPSSLSQGDVFTGWMLGWTGVIFQHSQLRIAEITDGTSQTYLLGEKTIDPDYYFDGLEYGDDWSWDTGQQDDISRQVAMGKPPSPSSSFTYYPPIQDTRGVFDYPGFGRRIPTV